MPAPGQMNAESRINPELGAALEASLMHRSGAISGGSPQVMTQAEGVLAARVAELCDEVRELRRLLAPPSAVILTGADVVEHFKRLNERKDHP